MPACPSYPPCTLDRTNTTDASSLLRSVVSVDSSKISIVGEKGEPLVIYIRQEINIEATSYSPSHIIHYFTPDAESKERLLKYTGTRVIMKLSSEDGSESLELILNLRR